jgi:hypothetical protein
MSSHTQVFTGLHHVRDHFSADDEARNDFVRFVADLYTGMAAENIGWREAEAPRTSRSPFAYEDVFHPRWMVMLQRAYALVKAGRAVTPISSPPEPDDLDGKPVLSLPDDPTADELDLRRWQLGVVHVDEEELEHDLGGVWTDLALDMSSHLVSHAPDQGVYIPVRFEGEVFCVYPGNSPFCRGGVFEVGSSQSLLTELCGVAPAIGVRLEPDGSLSTAEARAVHRTGADHPFAVERSAWLSLYGAALSSIRDDVAIILLR